MKLEPEIRMHSETHYVQNIESFQDERYKTEYPYRGNKAHTHDGPQDDEMFEVEG